MFCSASAFPPLNPTRQAYKFVLPMKRYPTCDFSFAGLKTSVRLCIEANVPSGAAGGVGPSTPEKAEAPSTSGATEDEAAVSKARCCILQEMGMIFLYSQLRYVVLIARHDGHVSITG